MATSPTRATCAYTYGSRPHAVTGAFTNTYGYDANGNMITRTVGGITYTQQWDAENRLAVITKTATGQVAQFVYDGDGLITLKIERKE